MRIYLSTHPASIISKAIQWFSNSNFSHGSMEDITRPLILHSTGSGLHFSYNTRFFKDNKILYEFEFIPELHHFDEVKDCFYEILPRLEDEYDYWAILGFVVAGILKKMGLNKISNFFAHKEDLFCFELIYVFIENCIAKGIVPSDLLDGYDRELFGPQEILRLMLSNKEVFRLCKPQQN